MKNKYDIKLIKEALDLIVYENSRYPLLELREWFNDDLLFAEFLERFTGCTFTLPEMSDLVNYSHKTIAADLIRNMLRAKDRRDLLTWGLEEGKIIDMSTKLCISKEKMKEIGYQTLKKYEEIGSWKKQNRDWHTKNMKMFTAQNVKKSSGNISFIDNARQEINGPTIGEADEGISEFVDNR